MIMPIPSTSTGQWTNPSTGQSMSSAYQPGPGWVETPWSVSSGGSSASRRRRRRYRSSDDKVSSLESVQKEPEVVSIPLKTSKITKLRQAQKEYDARMSSTIGEYEKLGQKYTYYRSTGGKRKKWTEAQITLGYVGLKAFRGATQPIIHPIKTGKGFIEMFQSPIVTGKKVVQEFRYDPWGTSAETAGQMYTFKKIGGVGTSAIIKGKGFKSTVGRKVVPLEQVIDPKVLKGIKTFPTAGKGLTTKQRQALHMKLFMSGKYAVSKRKGGYHATPKKWKELKTTKGTSEIPGTYVAPSISPHFLKVTKGKTTKYTFNPLTSLKDLTKSPRVMYISPTKFTKRTARKGQARVPGKKTEIEAVIPPDTALVKLKSSRYIKYKGHRIPIDEFKTVSGLKSKKALPIKKATKKYSSSYGKSYKSPYRIYSPYSSLKYSKLKPYSPKYSPYGIKGTKYSSPVYRGKSYKYYPKKSTYRGVPYGKPYYPISSATSKSTTVKKIYPYLKSKSKKLQRKQRGKQKIPYYVYTRTLLRPVKRSKLKQFSGVELR